MSCVEEEIDRMSESFLQLSVQLQKRAQMNTSQEEMENSGANHSVVISSKFIYYLYNCIN